MLKINGVDYVYKIIAHCNSWVQVMPRIHVKQVIHW